MCMPIRAVFLGDVMADQVKVRPKGLSKLDALRLSIKLWSHIEETGVCKSKAMEALGMCSSDYLHQCPCCEYVGQRTRNYYEGLQCEEHCPAWLEFSENFELGGDYPCVRNPNSPYSGYHGFHPAALEKDTFKAIASNMIKLLIKALERNLDDSE